ncbi:MAG: glycosyltransferase [Candidatus Omnitrophota bacterium]
MKVLIVYASAGSGHRRAAEAIYENLDIGLKNDSCLVDILDFTPSFFKLIYSGGYTFLIRQLPSLWSFFCWLTDRRILWPIFSLTRRILNICLAGRFVFFLKENNPRVIVTTHFKPNEILSNLKRKGQLDSYIISVITDYEVHSFWIQKGLDAHIVAIDSAKNDLIKRGIEESKIHVFGIPVPKGFLNLKKRKDAAKIVGVNPDRFCALLISGEIGLNVLARIALTLKDEIQVIVICGRNAKLFNKLKKVNHKNLFIFSLVENMHDYLACADLIITKAGGLTISESLIANLPMFFIPGIGGQEAGNIRVLTELKAAIYEQKIKNLIQKVLETKNNPRELSIMKERVRLISKPASNDMLNSLIKNYAR